MSLPEQQGTVNYGALMGFNQSTLILLRAQQVAQRQWRDVVAMSEKDEVDHERALLIEAARSVAYRLGQKALAALQEEEAQRLGL